MPQAVPLSLLRLYVIYSITGRILPVMKFLRSWRQDRLLRGVIKNSSYLFSGNTISMALSVVQSIFAARLLGVDGFGTLGVVTVFASTVNRLFSFRMGELVVKYMDQHRAENRPDRAAAVVKAAALAESITSLLAFAVLVLLSPLAAQIFAKDPAATPWFLIYGLIIPGNLATETSTGVLQIHRRFPCPLVQGRKPQGDDEVGAHPSPEFAPAKPPGRPAERMPPVLFDQTAVSRGKKMGQQRQGITQSHTAGERKASAQPLQRQNHQIYKPIDHFPPRVGAGRTVAHKKIGCRRSQNRLAAMAIPR